MTFDEITDDAQTMVKDKSNAAKAVIQKGINKGLTRLRMKLKRKYSIITRQFTITNNQSMYQLPESATQISRVSYVSGGNRTGLHRVDDENEWERMKGQTGETGTPEFFFVHSKDLFEIYPTPSQSAVGILRYRSRAKQLKASDYVTGTISVTKGSQLVQSTGAVFTSSMVGRSIKLENSDSERSDYYRIIAVDTTTNVLTLENYYDGETKTNSAYRIGEVPNIPEEFHPALSDYGLYYFYMWRKDKALAEEFLANFIQAQSDIADETDVVSNVIESKRHRGDSNLPNYRRTPRAV